MKAIMKHTPHTLLSWMAVFLFVVLILTLTLEVVRADNPCPEGAADNHFCSQNPNDKTWAHPACPALLAHEAQGRSIRFADHCSAPPEPTATPLQPTATPQPIVTSTATPRSTEPPTQPTETPSAQTTATTTPDSEVTTQFTPDTCQDTDEDCICIDIGEETMSWLDTWLERMFSFLERWLELRFAS